MGSSDKRESLTPLMVNLPNVVGIACGYYHTVATVDDGSVYVWGSNQFGQLGLGNVGLQKTPREIPNLKSNTPGRLFVFLKWIFLGRNELSCVFHHIPIEFAFHLVTLCRSCGI